MQRGSIYRKGSAWMLSYYRDERLGDLVQRRKVAQKLAPVNDQYRTVASVRPLAEVVLGPINAKRARPESAQSVESFIEQTFLPHCDESKRPSTALGYRYVYGYVKPHLRGIRLWEFRTSDGDKLLRAVAEDKPRAHSVLCNVKSFLSGAFRYAKRLDAIEHNPMHDTYVPRGKPVQETVAYTLAEVQAMLKVLPEPARTVVLVAALTGLRQSELRALRWEDVVGDDLYVRRGAWRTHVNETKTLTSSAPVPLLPVVQKALVKHRRLSPGNDFIFHGATGKPLQLPNVARRDVIPALEKAHIRWSGWHGFRRGLATLLYDLDVPDKTIQAILRHSNVSTTMKHYVKAAPAASHKAMQRLEKLLLK